MAVLGLLQVGPLHPYGIQRLLKLWGKDQVVNVGQRANLYRVINRLHDAGLISVRQTERDQQFPERTVYEATDEGRRVVREWLVAMLSTPRNAFPEFPAALSFVMGLTPQEAASVLDRRALAVGHEVARLQAELAQYSGTIPRVTLLESEYQLAIADAELRWIKGITEELRTGSLTWSQEDFETAIARDEAVLTAIDPQDGELPSRSG